MKLKIYFRLLTVIIISGLSFTSYAQQRPDSLRLKQARQQHAFYRKSLQVDSVKAEKVSQIQTSYKAGINQLMADTSLNDTAKRVRIKNLMDAKNQRLRLLLSPAQQAKVIPTTEREQTGPAKKN